MTNSVTRLAPSPTGTLHLGNVRTFLINWALARKHGWKIIARIEDLDRERVRSGSAEQILAAFAWLGIDFDEGPVWQSRNLERYRRAMRSLTGHGLAYACTRTRRSILMAVSAPHSGEGELRMPAELRPSEPGAFAFDEEQVNYRFCSPAGKITVCDQIAGTCEFEPEQEVGDFIIWTRLGVPAYQLAVVVDDALQGITDVVRGDDLLPSAARQALLYDALQLPMPRWWHVPLVVDADGRRLAKRDEHTHVEHYRAAGVRPQRLIGLVAHWCGMTAVRQEISAEDFRDQLDPRRLSGPAVRFTQEDHQWLLGE